MFPHCPGEFLLGLPSSEKKEMYLYMINHIPPKCLSEQREHSESFGYTHIETH